jgi:hypothetical protein
MRLLYAAINIKRAGFMPTLYALFAYFTLRCGYIRYNSAA